MCYFNEHTLFINNRINNKKKEKEKAAFFKVSNRAKR